MLLDGRDIGPGRQPDWHSDDIIMCAAPHGQVGLWRYVRTPQTDVWTREDVEGQAHATATWLAVSPAGWAYLDTARLVSWVTLEGWSGVAISPTGALALAAHRDGVLHILTPDEVGGPQVHSHRPVLPDSLRWTDAGLLWTEYDGEGQPQPWIGHASARRPVAVRPVEFACALAVDAHGQRWVLSLDDTDLLLRPEGAVDGYILATDGDTHRPDMRWMPAETQFRVVCTRGNGMFREFIVRPDVDPRCDLRMVAIRPPGPPVLPVPPPVPPVVVPTPPFPSRPPEAPVFPHIPDSQFVELAETLERIYRDDLGRTPDHQTAVDPLGRARWTTDYLTARARGRSHQEALSAMRMAVHVAAGLPGPAPQPQPPAPPGGPFPAPGDYRGALALEARQPSYGYLAIDDPGRRRAFRQARRDRGLTDVAVMLSGQYPGDGSMVPWFWLWGRDYLSTVRARMEELRADGLRVHLWACNGETLAEATNRGLFVVDLWAETVPVLRDLVTWATVGPEMNDFLKPQEQHDGARALKDLLPDAIHLVHYTRKRSHGAHQLAGHPGGPLPPAWRPYIDDRGVETASFESYWAASEGFVDGLYYNCGLEDVRAALLGDERPLRSDIGDVSVRLTGADVPGVARPGYHGRFRKRLIVGEIDAEHVVRGALTYDALAVCRRIARDVPGVSGVGD